MIWITADRDADPDHHERGEHAALAHADGDRGPDREPADRASPGGAQVVEWREAGISAGRLAVLRDARMARRARQAGRSKRPPSHGITRRRGAEGSGP